MRKLLPVAVIASALMAGCATISGVEISDEERAVCEVQGCSVWTMEELERLVRAAMAKGYEAGKKSL